MANAPDAGDVYSVPEDWCLRLGSPGSDQPIYAHDSLVRDALGDNQCVLLTRYHLEGPTSMSADEMVAWRGSLNQKVVCIGEQRFQKNHLFLCNIPDHFFIALKMPSYG